MRNFIRGSAVLFCLSLTSCASWSSTLSKNKIQKKIDLNETIDRALENPEFCKGYWPAENWWEMFEDKQLACLIETGLDSNPSLMVTESRVKQANQEAFVTRAKLLPQIQGFFNYLYLYLSQKGIVRQLRGVNPNVHLFALMFDFTYEFDFWRKNMNAYKAAIGLAKTQEAINQQTKMILSVSIAKQYYNLQANFSRLAILQELLENKTRLFQLIELRRVNRIETLMSVNDIKQEILSLQEAIAGLSGEIQLQQSTLLTLMGKNPGEKIKVTACWDLPDRPFELPDQIGLNLLTRRPDLIARVWRVYSMTKQVGVSVAQFFPDVNFFGLGGSDGVKFSDLFSSNSGTTTLLPYLVQPVFMGGKLRANLKAKLAEFEEAVHDYNHQLLAAANEVVSEITKIRSVQEKLTYQCEQVHSKQENYHLVYSRYQSGIDSMMKVLSSDYLFLKSRFHQIDLESERVQATIALVQALGGGYHFQTTENTKEIEKL